jgi:WD40 repeat protein
MDKKELGKKKTILLGHKAEVRCLAFPGDGITTKEGAMNLISGGADGQVHQWNPAKGMDPKRSFQAHSGPVNGVGYFFADLGFVTVGDDLMTKTWIWNGEEPAQLRKGFRTNSQPITSLAMSASSRFLITGSLDESIKLVSTQVDAKKGNPFLGWERFTFMGLNTPILGVALSASDSMLAGAGEDGRIILRHAPLPK